MLDTPILLIYFACNFVLCVSSLSLALVLPEYSMHYLKANIGDTITQAKCKCHLNQFNGLLHSLYALLRNTECISLRFLSITYDAPYM